MCICSKYDGHICVYRSEDDVSISGQHGKETFYISLTFTGIWERWLVAVCVLAS